MVGYAAAALVGLVAMVAVCFLCEAVLHPYRSAPRWSTMDYLWLSVGACVGLTILAAAVAAP